MRYPAWAVLALLALSTPPLARAQYEHNPPTGGAQLAPDTGATGPAAATGGRRYFIFVDTAGIAPVGADIFETYVFARSVNRPDVPPVSAVIVDFNCKTGETRRRYHVVYRPNDSVTGVTGTMVEDDTGWGPHNPREATYDTVCRIGAARLKAATPESGFPES